MRMASTIRLRSGPRLRSWGWRWPNGAWAGRAVAGGPIGDLAAFYSGVWQRGAAGTAVPLTLRREGKVRNVTVRSIDRGALLKKPLLQ